MTVQDFGIGNYHVISYTGNPVRVTEYLNSVFGHLSAGVEVIELGRLGHRTSNLVHGQKTTSEERIYSDINNRFSSVERMIMDEITKTKRKGMPLSVIVECGSPDGLDLELLNLYRQAVPQKTSLKDMLSVRH